MSASGHPYIPNSAPGVRDAMLQALGLADVDDLFQAIPERLRTHAPLDVPPMHTEQALRQALERLLAQNRGCEAVTSFLGGGCWQHYVPAVCDEINQRAEFLTSYAGQLYSDHGKLQALFEYQSMIGELVGLDVVALPTYDWAAAAATAILIASRLTGRREALVAGSVGPERLQIVRGYCAPDVNVTAVPCELGDGRVDLAACKELLSSDVGAVYMENPSFLGVIDDRGGDLAELAHAIGALCVVGVDPISLGVLEAPRAYGADIACGELQPLGMHMHYGGGLAGFIATPDDERYIDEIPANVLGLTTTSVVGERGFGYIRPERTIYSKRENGKEFTGTTTGLWGITAAVYLALLGPDGLYELGKTILQRAQYAARRIGAIPGLKAPALQAAFFKEFVVQFDDDELTVASINRGLLERGWYGGHDVGADFPDLPRSALYCVTELHSRETIDSFADDLGALLERGPTAKESWRDGVG